MADEAQYQRRRVEREQRPPRRRERVGEHQTCPYGKDGEGDRGPDDVPPGPGANADGGRQEENHHPEAGSVTEVPPQVTREKVRARAGGPAAYPAEEIAPQVENIDAGQPERIVGGARQHAPGEAGEGRPVDVSRLEHHQDSEDPEQGENKKSADHAQ
jgi:hypothetical protein